MNHLMHLEGAESLAEYNSNFYASTPAVTKHSFGSGVTYYIGTDMDAVGIAKVLELAAEDAKVTPVLPEKTALEITRRDAETGSYYFLINFQDEPQTVPASLVGFTDVITGTAVSANDTLNKFDVKIIFVTR